MTATSTGHGACDTARGTCHRKAGRSLLENTESDSLTVLGKQNWGMKLGGRVGGGISMGGLIYAQEVQYVENRKLCKTNKSGCG